MNRINRFETAARESLPQLPYSECERMVVFGDALASSKNNSLYSDGPEPATVVRQRQEWAELQDKVRMEKGPVLN